MYFQLRKLVLWPRSGGEPRTVDFVVGAVNVISGASKKGKSAVIPIIDYCLGAEKCAIPVGVIRESCSWFGVLIDTIEGQKLLARREPGSQQTTGDMVLIEGDSVAVPDVITGKTTNVDNVKDMLNRLSGLTNLEFEPAGDSGFRARPSFRDLMAFTFQPQNIVANPDVMFFKADTTEHREKLKTIFPYVLGAVTGQVLQAKFEIDRLTRLLRRKEAELRAIQSASHVWMQEAQGWLRQAIELGLAPADQGVPEEWPDLVDLLRVLAGKKPNTASPSLQGIDVVLDRLGHLRAEEAVVAAKLTDHRQRLNELRRLIESSEAYGGAIRIQRDRLALSDWLRSFVESEQNQDAVGGLTEGRERVLELCDGLSALEMRLRTHPTISDRLDKEVLRLRGLAEETIERLNEIRKETEVLERDSKLAHEAVDHFERSERFAGRLEQALKLYDQADQTLGVRKEVDELQERIAVLQGLVSESEIRRRLRNALDRIEATTARLIPKLDAEWPDAPIRLVIEDLTVKVIRGDRDDYLWEVGSGANWLAYHVALTVALQRFFLEEPHHPVPGLLVYDQPSQVYFPRRLAGVDAPEPTKLRDQDVVAVRKVFELLGMEAAAAKGRLQLIVLDHAGAEVWGGIEGVKLVEDWRDDALVPYAWFTEE